MSAKFRIFSPSPPLPCVHFHATSLTKLPYCICFCGTPSPPPCADIICSCPLSELSWSWLFSGCDAGMRLPPLRWAVGGFSHESHTTRRVAKLTRHSSNLARNLCPSFQVEPREYRRNRCRPVLSALRSIPCCAIG